MQKIHRLALVGVLASLVIASAATAETQATGTPRERMQEKQQQLEERRQKLIKQHAQNIERRFSEATERFENIADRIGSRLDKLAAEGANVSEARAKLTSA